MFDLAIIGAGPAGLFLGSALAGRGHDVVAVDRDPRPPAGRWRRPGVMQFHHAHAFRQQVGMALRREWPSALDAWLALGAEPISFDLPGVGLVHARIRWSLAGRIGGRFMKPVDFASARDGIARATNTE